MTYFQKACVYPWLEGALEQTLDLEGDVGAGCLDPDITNIMTMMTMMMISLDDRDDVVSRPTRWSLWYWYLDVYVDHIYISKSKWQRNIVQWCDDGDDPPGLRWGGLECGSQWKRDRVRAAMGNIVLMMMFMLVTMKNQLLTRGCWQICNVFDQKRRNF